jgi:alkaline phosphatase D
MKFLLMRSAVLFLWMLLLSAPLLAQGDLLQSGPMVGYSEMKEVMLWVQTRFEARVFIQYTDQQEPAKKYRTQEVVTRQEKGYTAHLLADQVQPGKKYSYEVFVNGKKVERPYPLSFQSQALWQYRSDPPDFKFASGSCAYISEAATDRPGQPYGGGYQVFTTISKQNPDFMLWLGDNVYLREPDWNTRTGILHRYTHSRSLPELQPLLGNVHHYAIWDDHDYGPNDSDRSFWNKAMTRELFEAFWANPNYGVGGTEGITGTFQWADCEFFLMDDRYYRSPNQAFLGDRELLGKQQVDWLIEALINSRATFKFIAVGGQVLNAARIFENYANYDAERQRLLDGIRQNRIPGVIFLTGDRHHTVLNKVDYLYDLTTSPLTSGTATPKDNETAFQVPGTMVAEKNFALLEVTGSQKEGTRKLTIHIMGTEGKEFWKKEILAKDLKP